jgi:hypothetical protein
MLHQALDLAASCQAAYQLADPKVRRMYNQVFFNRILLDNDDISTAQLAEPFAELLAHDLVHRFNRETPNPSSPFDG